VWEVLHSRREFGVVFLFVRRLTVFGALPDPGGTRGQPRSRVAVNAQSPVLQVRLILCYRGPGVWNGCMILINGMPG
ncbi:hypothetical protein A2U01_0071099, partial [Trifolium medium]|nr:hypothetical protein [Trifolium medium]